MMERSSAFDPSTLTPELNAVTNELRNESDRGAAIVGVEYLHQLVKQLVCAHMVEERKLVGKLLEYPGALCTASSQIELAFALGWIGPQMYGDLTVARGIRNRFSHSHTRLSFGDAGISQECGRFKALAFSKPYRLRKPKDQFLFALLMLMLQLTELRQRTRTPAKGIDPPVHRFDGPPRTPGSLPD